ncbi:hypothetical protein KM043_010380 [Ampulex compressa]|nr:hypothetical protein KM043_010380 [Ampulex compressa]
MCESTAWPRKLIKAQYGRRTGFERTRRRERKGLKEQGGVAPLEGRRSAKMTGKRYAVGGARGSNVTESRRIAPVCARCVQALWANRDEGARQVPLFLFHYVAESIVNGEAEKEDSR